MPLKTSEFNFFTRSFCQESVLAFNTFTGRFAAMSVEEFQQLTIALEHVKRTGQLPRRASENIKLLAKSGFVVDQAVDERLEVRKRYWKKAPKTKRGLALTIAPTVACNLRCTYCFQEHPDRRMSEVDRMHILKHVDCNLHKGTYLGVTWFGGEPLLELAQVMELAGELRELARDRACRYSHHFISNGLLLREEAISLIASFGDLTSIQVTLDGPKDIHDARRLRAGGQGTFDKILCNLKRAAGRLPLVVRVNVDRRNYERIPDLLLQLAESGLREHVFVDLGHVLAYTEASADAEPHALTKAEFASVQAQARLALFRLGFNQKTSLPKPLRGNLCIADNPSGAVFAPGGLNFKCWNETAMDASHASGYLHKHERRENLLRPAELRDTERQMLLNRKAWQDYDPFVHSECQTCQVQPLCMGGCPWEARKKPLEGPGHCTAYRFNLGDTLRLYHLQGSLIARQRAKGCCSRETHVIVDSS
ncbi:MAG: hypothetical protein HONBIEJF_00918 [Fimbriimonadaceae bacterium]|nr:hypothetical protein [Fimbriimonadaceae bacterium]